ncbi:MAG TPA: stage II sporulation protein M [Anaerolineae bacterium]|nr:stage II sporulation protein M [Anaerolineae bacterium]
MTTDAGVRARRSSPALVWTVARRELRDTLRDWRIVTPILVLTLVFPWLMNWTAQLAIDFVERREAAIIGERLMPFLLMIVGFFPVTFSLIIGLETFGGEKERRSIEPLLSMPISDLELYLGKMLSATALPLLGGLLGIGVYLAGLYLSIGYLPPPQLLAQILGLNVVTAVMMVSGAVVISSQTTSVRAANLLASFIIVPTALLMQAESIIMFWGYYDALWAILAALVLVTLILVRMGIRSFNREEILGREIDELNLRRSLRLCLHHFLRSPAPPAAAEGPARGPALLRWLLRVYRTDLPYLLKRNRMPLAMVALFVVVAAALGWALVDDYPLPRGSLALQNLSRQDFESLSNVSFLPSLTTGGILFHNARVLLLAALLAVISLGVLAVLMLMVPMGLVGFIAGQVAAQGQDALAFVAAFVLPHGILEIPAAVIATAFALRVGASLTAPPEGMTVGENLLVAVADLAKVFLFLVLPLLGLAAFLEANVTPEIVLWAYGG